MTRPDPDRDARLAAALRDNLRRRKAQGRDLADQPDLADQKADDTQAASE